MFHSHGVYLKKVMCVSYTCSNLKKIKNNLKIVNNIKQFKKNLREIVQLWSCNTFQILCVKPKQLKIIL